MRFVLLALCTLPLLTACSEDIAELGQAPTVTVEPKNIELDIGQKTTLSVLVQNASSTAVLFRTSAPNIATVNQAGEVTALAAGSAQISVMSQRDTTARANVMVNVRTPNQTQQILPTLGLGRVTERFTAEVAVRGTWAYTSTWGNTGIAGGNAVKIWNVSGDTPLLTDSLIITGAGTTGDVQISDDGALLVVSTEASPPGSIVIYDRSNPAKPTQLSRFSSANTTSGVHTVKLGRVNGRHYAFLSVNPGSVPAQLVIVDITNPSSPQQVFAQQMGRPFVHDVFVRDGILFAALWHDGMRIFDIGGGGRGGTPAAPVVIGNGLTASGQIHNIWWFHDPQSNSKRYVFLGEEGPGSPGQSTASGDIHVFDISNMAAPIYVATYNLPGAGTHNFWMDEASGILYAAYYNGGVRALDVRGDLSNCTAAQRTGSGICNLRLMGREVAAGLTTGSFIWGVVHQGTHVYASDMKLGLFKLDASRLVR